MAGDVKYSVSVSVCRVLEGEHLLLLTQTGGSIYTQQYQRLHLLTSIFKGFYSGFQLFFCLGCYEFITQISRNPGNSVTVRILSRLASPDLA